MAKNSNTCGFLFALAGGVVFAVSAAAQPVDLRFNLPAGTTYAVKSSETMQMQAQVKNQSGNAQQMNRTYESPTNYRVQVLQGTAGVGGDPAPAHVRFTFDPGQAMAVTDGQNGRQLQTLPYAGQTFEVVRQNGRVNITPVGGNDGESLAPETQQKLENLATFRESTLLPGHPVSVGDTWNPDTTAIMKAAQMAPGGSLQMTARLTGLGQAAGRPTALLDLEMLWNGTVQGLVMKGPQSGKASIDLATGLLLAFDMRGQVQISAAPEMGADLNGTANLVSTRAVSNLQTPAIQGGNGPEVVTITEEDLGGGSSEVVNINEEDLGGGGGGTINVRAPAFGGTYVGEKLSVTLIEGERRTIEIRRGETVAKGYLTGNREISQRIGADGVGTVITFQGFFEFNGTKFPFNAEQPAPGVMQFTTGKTTHDLKLKVAAPAAPNPFE